MVVRRYNTIKDALNPKCVISNGILRPGMDEEMHGVFCIQNIYAGEFICAWNGIVITEYEFNRHNFINTYDMSKYGFEFEQDGINKYICPVLDNNGEPAVEWHNLAVFINEPAHNHETKQKPDGTFQFVQARPNVNICIDVDSDDAKLAGVPLIFARRNIAAGDELVWTYGVAYDRRIWTHGVVLEHNLHRYKVESSMFPRYEEKKIVGTLTDALKSSAWYEFNTWRHPHMDGIVWIHFREFKLNAPEYPTIDFVTMTCESVNKDKVIIQETESVTRYPDILTFYRNPWISKNTQLEYDVYTPRSYTLLREKLSNNLDAVNRFRRCMVRNQRYMDFLKYQAYRADKEYEKFRQTYPKKKAALDDFPEDTHCFMKYFIKDLNNNSDSTSDYYDSVYTKIRNIKVNLLDILEPELLSDNALQMSPNVYNELKSKIDRDKREYVDNLLQLQMIYWQHVELYTRHQIELDVVTNPRTYARKHKKPNGKGYEPEDWSGLAKLSNYAKEFFNAVDASRDKLPDEPQKRKRPTNRVPLIPSPSTKQNDTVEEFLKYATDCLHNTLAYADIPEHVRTKYESNIEYSSWSKSGYEHVYMPKQTKCFQLRFMGSDNKPYTRSFADPKTAALVLAIMKTETVDFDTALQIVHEGEEDESEPQHKKQKLSIEEFEQQAKETCKGKGYVHTRHDIPYESISFEIRNQYPLKVKPSNDTGYEGVMRYGPCFKIDHSSKSKMVLFSSRKTAALVRAIMKTDDIPLEEALNKIE